MRVYGAVAIVAGVLGLVWHNDGAQVVIAVFGASALVETGIAGSCAATTRERKAALGFAFVAILCVGLLPLLSPPIAAGSIVALLALWFATESLSRRGAMRRAVMVLAAAAAIGTLLGTGLPVAASILAVMSLLAGVTQLIANPGDVNRIGRAG